MWVDYFETSRSSLAMSATGPWPSCKQNERSTVQCSTFGVAAAAFGEEVSFLEVVLGSYTATSCKRRVSI